ncbi:MAG: ATP-binding protein [Planctomycetota bacterium]
MLRSRLFWKLLLASAALNAVGLLVLGAWVIAQQRQQEIDAAAAELRGVLRLCQSLLIREQAAIGPGDAFRETLPAVASDASEATGDRVVFLDVAERVLADSVITQAADGGGPALERVALVARGAVADARVSGFGLESRRTTAAGVTVLHAAERVDEALPVSVVCVIRELPQLEERVADKRNRLIAVAAMVTLGFAAAAAGLAQLVVRPVQSLRDAADAIASGDYKKRAYVSSDDELGDLARSFNKMREELGSQLTELREGGQRQTTVLGGMIEGVIAVDDRERVLFANTAAGRLFGFIPPQIEGRPLLEVVRLHTLHEAVASALASARPQRLETEWEEAAERRMLLVQVTPLPGDPCPGVVTVLHDTTELRRLESLRSDFVANVSHELKTPLSSIKAYTETLIDGAVNDPEHNMPFLRRIEEQADRLNYLIQDLLALARIESEQQPFEIRPVAVADVIGSCLADYRPRAEGKQIELVAEGPPQPLHAKADAEGLRLIVNNLVDNAIKYTSISGRVAVRWGAGEAGMVKIEVEDTGIGIPAESLPRVFERFFRVDKARSRELGGTGLGLAIVKHLAQAFGGHVDVTSEVGKGTVFSVELPAA